MRFSNKQFFLFGLIIIAVGAALGSVSLTYPFGRDQGIYAYAGKLLLEGKMNYLYVFDLKPPGIHFLFAFAQFIAGESMFNMRVFDIIWQSLTALIVFFITFRLTQKKSLSVVSALIYALLYFRLDYWHTLQADGMLNLPFALSILLLLYNERSHSFIRVFFAGVLFALALTFKYTVISYLPLLFLSIYFFSGGLRSLKTKNVLIYSTGTILLGVAILLLYYFTGSLDELINIQFVQTPLYTGIAYETESQAYISSQLIRLFTVSVYAPLIWLTVIAAFGAAIRKKIDFGSVILFSWFISSLFSLIFQWKFYYYHFLVIIPPLAIGASVFASNLVEYLKKEGTRKFAVAGLVLLLAGFTAFAFKPYLNNYSILYSLVSEKNSLKEVYELNGVTEDSVFMIGKTFRAVDAVKQYSQPFDEIYVWGFDPLVYYLSGRKCTSRFIYNFPLLWKAENRELKSEFINAIKSRSPKLILVAKNDPLIFISGFNEDSKGLLSRFPEFHDLLTEKYLYKNTIDDFEYYELKYW